MGVTSTGSGITATPSDIPPGNVPSLAATSGDGFVDLSWSYPADTDLLGLKILRKAGSPPVAHDDPNADVILDNTDLTVVAHKDSTVTNNTIYIYAAYAYDKRQPVPNYSPVGKESSPVKPEDITAPGPVTLVTQTPAAGLVVLTWQNPTDADFQGIKVLRKETAFPTPADPNDPAAVIVYEGKAQTVTDDNNGVGLTNGAVYYYALFAYDEVPNYSPAELISATPQGEITKPTVSTTIPAGDAAGVDPTLPVEVTFSEDILASSVVDGVLTLTTNSGKNISLEPPAMPTTNSVSEKSVAGQLPLATTIKAVLPVADPNAMTPIPGITDLSGNVLDPTPSANPGQYDWSFTTADGHWGSVAEDLNNYAYTATPRGTGAAIDNKGNAVVVWRGFNGTNSVIMAKYYSPLTGWSVGETNISQATVFGNYPVIKLDNSGNALLVWFERPLTSDHYSAPPWRVQGSLTLSVLPSVKVTKYLY